MKPKIQSLEQLAEQILGYSLNPSEAKNYTKAAVEHLTEGIRDLGYVLPKPGQQIPTQIGLELRELVGVRFECIQAYPGIPLGTVVDFNYDLEGYVIDQKTSRLIPRADVEDNPDFWKRIENKHKMARPYLSIH